MYNRRKNFKWFFKNQANLANVDFFFQQNKRIAVMGEHAAKVARYDIEKNLGKSVISKENALNYQYIDENKQIENKVNEYTSIYN